LREYREEAGMSLRGLARRAGIHPGYLSHIELGRHHDGVQGPPGYLAYRRLVAALRLSEEKEERLYRAWRAGASQQEKRLANVVRPATVRKDAKSASAPIPRIPILKTVPAGDSTKELRDYPRERLVAVAEDIVVRYPSAFAYVVEDDDMAPRACEGDRVVVAPSADIVPGHPHVVAFQEQRERMMRCYYVQPVGSGLQLWTERRDLPPNMVPFEDVFWAYPIVVVEHYLL